MTFVDLQIQNGPKDWSGKMTFVNLQIQNYPKNWICKMTFIRLSFTLELHSRVKDTAKNTSGYFILLINEI
jgi:hypothetical protein